MKPNKENIVTELLIELEKGIDRGEALAKVGTKWQMASRTFDRYWKVANDRHAENQQATQKALADQRTELEKEALKKAILSKDEILIELTKIALGQVKTKYYGKLQPASFSERIAAFRTINEMQGNKAVTKTELTGSVKVETEQKLDLTKLSTEVLMELEKTFKTK